MQRVASVMTGLVIAVGVTSAQTTELVSVTSAGALANASSFYSSISADGRFVAFESFATSLVPGDTNAAADIFVRDRLTGVTERVSVATGGAQANGVSRFPSISADGRFVAFESDAPNLVAGDTNATMDAFVRDRQMGTTERVSLTAAGAQGNSASGLPSISDDGRFVAFESSASNLVAGDTNAAGDIFVRDRQGNTTERASVAAGGAQANSFSRNASISGDGRRVAFEGFATNLVPGDTNASADVFVRDLASGTTERASVATGGAQANSASLAPRISGDGRYVAFFSGASNLVAGDTNAWADVFVRDRQSGTTERVSVSTAGAQGDFHSFEAALSADGRIVAFWSFASSLVAGDTNPFGDVFVRDRQRGTTVRVSVSTSGSQADAGSSNPSLSADGRFVAFFSGATNLVAGDTNGVDDVFAHHLALSAVTYCTAGTTTNGCLASISGVGSPSASSGSGFTLGASNVEGQKQGLFFYGLDNSGFSPAAWGASASFLCVKAPTQRTTTQSTGGTSAACDGALALDWNAFVAANPTALGAPFLAGQHVFAQAWFRDPPSPKTTNLSNALEFVVGP